MDLVFSGLVAMGGGVSSSSSVASLVFDALFVVREEVGVAEGAEPVRNQHQIQISAYHYDSNFHVS